MATAEVIKLFQDVQKDTLQRQEKIKAITADVPSIDSMAVGSPGIAQTPPVVHNESMNDITRPELDAKLSATEERMNARVASIESKIDTFLAVQAERDKATEARFASIELEAAGTRADIKSLKKTIVVTAISVVLTILFGIAGFNAALTSNMFSAFQIGLTLPGTEAQTAPPPTADK